MAQKPLRRRHGLVVILDALGASSYSTQKIKKFLSVRKNLNQILSNQAKKIAKFSRIKMPNTYTFGDTLIIVIELSSKKNIKAHIKGSIVLMRNYLFHSMKEGILFRGAFSIGSYIEEPDSNTVMGEAISDAASWYEKAEWMGLHSTPKTNNDIEYYFSPHDFDIPEFVHYYPVPMKDGREIELYTISWAGRFFDSSDDKSKNPKKRFLGLIKDHQVPFGAELKFENTKKYFSIIENTIIANKANAPDAKSSAAD